MEYKKTYIQKVAWGDMDAFHHVNNTVYLKYFESARVQYFDSIPELAGFKGEEIPVLANISCNFKKPVTYPDTLTLKVGVLEMGMASLKMSCEMHSPISGLSAIAECTIVLINRNTGKSVRIPALWRSSIESIENRIF